MLDMMRILENMQQGVMVLDADLRVVVSKPPTIRLMKGVFQWRTKAAITDKQAEIFLLLDDDMKRAISRPGRNVGRMLAQFVTRPRDRETDLVAAVPLSFAQSTPGVEALEIGDLPFEQEKILYKLAWHRRSYRDSARSWLRVLIRDIINRTCSRR